MKKSKLSITLVTSFIAAMALSACSSVSAKKDTIVTFTPYGSKESISLLTNDVYNQYKNSNAGVSKFYEKILEVLIRYEFKNKEFDGGEKNYKEIEAWAKNEVQAQKDKAKANAKSNGTNYDDEWNSILESNSVENANELQEKYIYEKEKEVIKDWYADNIDAKLKEEFLGVKADGTAVDSKVKAAMPYHIRHILVKVDEASDAQEKFYKGTISESQAKLLYDTVSTLAEGKYTFTQVAQMYSEDGSADQGGDVGIMTNNATSGSLGMVNEFQLGLYAYDNIYDTSRATNAAASTIKAGLGITDEVIAKLPEKVAVVPYEAFVNIGKYAKVTADKYGNQLGNGSSTLYPRNILWNKYLNMHNVFLIKNAKCGAAKFGAADAKAEFSNLITDTVYDGSLAGFDATSKYLTDGRGNLIIGVRSEYGIHLMVIEKSMYDYADLATYYDTKVPGQAGYDKDAVSYVNYIVSQNKDEYKKRADDVKSKITSFDSTYDYRLYQWLTGPDKYKDNITFTGAAEGLDKLIDNYISFTQETNATKQEEGLEKVWKNYYRLLDAQKEDREAQFNTVDSQGNAQNNLTRLVSEKVATDFFALYEGTGNNYADFAEGGDYYYYA